MSSSVQIILWIMLYYGMFSVGVFYFHVYQFYDKLTFHGASF